MRKRITRQEMKLHLLLVVLVLSMSLLMMCSRPADAEWVKISDADGGTYKEQVCRPGPIMSVNNVKAQIITVSNKLSRLETELSYPANASVEIKLAVDARNRERYRQAQNLAEHLRKLRIIKKQME